MMDEEKVMAGVGTGVGAGAYIKVERYMLTL